MNNRFSNSKLIDSIYPSKFFFWVNWIFFPLKMLIPQPFLTKIPWLLNNEELRISHVLYFVEGRLADIGCGNNRLVKKYRKFNGNGIGIDIYDWPGADMVVENTACLPFPDNSFDTITFVASLNHIPNRLEVLKEAHRLLSEKGQLVVTNLLPVISRIWHAWAFWDKDQKERGMKDGEVWGFYEQEITNLFKTVGFEIVFKKKFSWQFNKLYVCRKLEE